MRLDCILLAIYIAFTVFCCLQAYKLQQTNIFGANNLPKCRASTISDCPSVPEAKNFDLDKHLGHWYIIETTLALPECAFADRKAIKSYTSPTKTDTSYSPSSDGWKPSSNAKREANFFRSGKRSNIKTQEQSYETQTKDEIPLDSAEEVQTLTVNYLDVTDKTVKTIYSGKTTKMTYNGASFRNTFTSGSVSDVTILYADYDPTCGYHLMITCTTKQNGDFEVNANILARTPYLDQTYLKNLYLLLRMYGLKELEERLKTINHQNCQPSREPKVWQQKTEY
jgi:hypothetical protein